MGNWAGGGYQDRYTSICMNESVRTTRVNDCAYDENIPVDANHNYTAVVSRTEDRPANATAFCGIAWIQWSPHGDGASRVGDALTDDDGGFVQIRNMLPDPSFAQAIQNTHTPGDEKAVMGDYLPDTHYAADAAAFQSQQGCDWANPGVPHLAAGSSTPNNGSFTLTWDPTRDAAKFPNLRYMLQHNDGSGWTDVATDLSSQSYTFTAGSPEADGTFTYRVSAHDGTSVSGFAGTSDPVLSDTTDPSLSVTCPAAVLAGRDGVGDDDRLGQRLGPGNGPVRCDGRRHVDRRPQDGDEDCDRQRRPHRHEVVHDAGAVHVQRAAAAGQCGRVEHLQAGLGRSAEVHAHRCERQRGQQRGRQGKRRQAHRRR